MADSVIRLSDREADASRHIERVICSGGTAFLLCYSQSLHFVALNSACQSVAIGGDVWSARLWTGFVRKDKYDANDFAIKNLGCGSVVACGVVRFVVGGDEWVWAGSAGMLRMASWFP